MKIKKDEIGLIILTYILCMALFFNLAILKDPMDMGAIRMGVIICVLLTVIQFLIHKFYPQGDKFLIIFACILSVIGVAMMYRIDIALAKNFATKQFIYFLAGIVIFIGLLIAIPDMKLFGKYKKAYLIATIVIMPIALLLGKEINGASNWVRIGGFSFQPSEIGKITFTLYLAAALKGYKDKNNIMEDFNQLWEPALVCAYCLGCLIIQKDLGSALIFFGIALTMLYVATGKKKYIFVTFALAAIGSILAYKILPHVQDRIDIWLNPKTPDNLEHGGRQIVNGLYSIASGGMFGSGLGQGYPYTVPIPESDMIFAVICEEFGMIFGVGIMLIYFLFFYRGMRASFRIKDNFSLLVTVGFSAMIACQVIVIIGGVLAIIPLTGITLPLVSYGGSSMLTMYFCLAIIQKISEEG